MTINRDTFRIVGERLHPQAKEDYTISFNHREDKEGQLWIEIEATIKVEIPPLGPFSTEAERDRAVADLQTMLRSSLKN